MKTPPLRQVRDRLERTIAGLPDLPDDAEERIEVIQGISYQVLDSEHMDFDENLLCESLWAYLYLCKLELGLVEDFNGETEQ